MKPYFDIWPSLRGYRVVLVKGDVFESLGEFATLHEAGDAKRAAERLVHCMLQRTAA